jgi:hypothetical protein
VTDANLLAEVERLHPDVIVFDVTVPGQDGITDARQLKRASPAKLVHEDPDSVRTAYVKVWLRPKRWFPSRSVKNSRFASRPRQANKPSAIGPKWAVTLFAQLDQWFEKGAILWPWISSS